MTDELTNVLLKAGVELGIETTKIVGKTTIELIRILLEYMQKQNKNLKVGKNAISKFINSEGSLKMTELTNKKDLKKFNKEAKKNGVPFSVIKDKNIYKIVYRQEDIERVKNAFESTMQKPLKKLVTNVRNSVIKIRRAILKKVKNNIEKLNNSLNKNINNLDDQLKEKKEQPKEIKAKEFVRETKETDVAKEGRQSVNKLLESIDVDKINRELKAKTKTRTNENKKKVGRPRKTR
jgi:hypothetical protein